MLTRLVAMALIAGSVCACSKIPESEEAKKVGNIPKQTIDRAKSNLDQALKAGEQRDRDADDKQDKP